MQRKLSREPKAIGSVDLFAPGPLPLYARVANVMRERIRNGEWVVGSQIPTIGALREIYGVAEITLRQAIRMLSEDGLLQSWRGKGTFVLANKAHVPVEAIDTVVDQFNELNPTHRIEIIERESQVAGPSWYWLPGKAAPSYVHIRKAHRDADGVCYALFDMHVESTAYARLPRGLDEKDKLIRLLRLHAKVRVASAKQRMTVGAAEFHEAQWFNCPVGAPVARVQRIYLLHDSVVVMYGAIVYAGERFVFEQDYNAPSRTA